MECSCEVDVDIDEDGPSFFKTKTIKAIKEHKCCECKRIISKGEKYEKTSGFWDGSFDEFKTCADCISMREEFFTSGYYYERIWELFSEHVDAVCAAISESCLSKLTPVACGRACDIIQAWWDEDDLSRWEQGLED
jgi:hypothetical protein